MEQALPRAARIVHQGLLPWGNGISVPPGHGCGRAQELSEMRQGGNNTQMLSYTAPGPAGVREGSGTSAARVMMPMSNAEPTGIGVSL